MRHAKARHQLNRFTSWNRATIASLIQGLLLQQRIRTTLGKAKAMRPRIEKLISLARQDTLANKRRAFRILRDHSLVSLLFNDIAKRFTHRNGGYTRILLLGNRRGDNAPLALIELTEIKIAEKKIKKAKETKLEESPAAQEKPEPEKPAVEKEKEAKTATAVKEKPKPPSIKKPSRNFLGGLKGIFKKERDSL